ncbi:MAG: hypothetical protein K6G38_06255 [Gammaproteobacteria bacterium]|nr:hypothetical protein [Gammaproteobacteria bacterium]
MMSLDKLIKDKFGSIDKLLEETETSISRSYLYQIVTGEKVNVTMAVMEELQRILELPSLDDVKEAIKNVNKEV